MYYFYYRVDQYSLVRPPNDRGRNFDNVVDNDLA